METSRLNAKNRSKERKCPLLKDQGMSIFSSCAHDIFQNALLINIRGSEFDDSDKSQGRLRTGDARYTSIFTRRRMG